MKNRTSLIEILLCSIIFCIISFAPLSGQQLAFPGAEGFGKYTSGGRGGRVIEVTTLEDMDRYGVIASGSFREALQTEGEDPITIVFRVSGIIELSGELKAKRSNMTIAGQTAPGDGICIKDASVKISGENIIIRYMRFRPGDETRTQVSCLNIENSKNIIIDHCSMSWSIEENMGFYDNINTTVQWCILSESLYDSYHSKGPRGYASQWGGQYASYHHNLLAHHKSRSPRINGSKSNDTISLCDYRNNVIFNYGKSNSIYGGDQHLFWDPDSNDINDAGCFVNFVNNYLKPGPAYSGSTFLQPLGSVSPDTVGYAEWYINGNIIEGYDDVTNDNWLGVDVDQVDSIENIKVAEEHEVDSITFHTALEAYDIVLENVGARKPKLDTVDSRIIAEVKGEKAVIGNGIIDSQTEVGGWPEYRMPAEKDIPADSDKDGIPDYWETENNLDPNNANDGKEIAADGYTNLEHYLNSDIPYIQPAPTSIHSKILKPVYLYPNPVKNILFFSNNIDISTIEIFRIDGKKIYEEVIQPEQSFINLKNIEKGLYFVNLSNPSGYSFSKIMIKE